MDCSRDSPGFGYDWQGRFADFGAGGHVDIGKLPSTDIRHITQVGTDHYFRECPMKVGRPDEGVLLGQHMSTVMRATLLMAAVILADAFSAVAQRSKQETLGEMRRILAGAVCLGESYPGTVIASDSAG